MVKAAEKGLPGNRYGLDMNSAPELYRHNPLDSVARRQSPDAHVTWSYDFPQPISNNPHNTPATGRGDNTPQTHIDTDLAVPASPISGSSRTHIADSPPKQDTDSQKDAMYKAKWRAVFCEYAKTRDQAIIEKARAAFIHIRQSVAEAAEVYAYILRMQS